MPATTTTLHAAASSGPTAVTAAPCPKPATGVRTQGTGSGKTVALTFDDGPGPSTPATLAVLRKYGVRATFFNVGEHMQAHPDLVREMSAEGHLLGNHTWDHKHLSTLSGPQQGAEMDSTTAEQLAIVGTVPCVFRPPYGDFDANTAPQANARGMTVWNWSLTTQDWKADASTSSYWVNRIITKAEAGVKQRHPVILMHNGPAPGDPPAMDGGDPATVKALPTIIAFYRKHGYAFVDLLGHRGYTPYAPTGAPAPAAATTGKDMHVFVRDAAGHIDERTLHNGKWSAARGLGADTANGPAVAATSATSMLLAVTDGTGHVQVRDVGTHSASAWTSLGGSAVGRPAAAANPATGAVTVVTRTTSGALAFRQRVRGHWRPSTPLGGTFVTSPAVAMTPDGRVTVVAATGDGRVWVRSHHTTWSAWHVLDGVTTADPALATTADGRHLVLLMRTTTGTIHRRVGNSGGTGWGAWKSLAGVSVSGPAATSANGRLDVLTVSPTRGVLVARSADPGALVTWTGWSRLPLASR